MSPVPPGVSFIDHTADVGMIVRAPTPEALFHCAALGMLALLRGEDEEPATEMDPAGPERTGPRNDRVELNAADSAGLLADWLRELLLLHEVEQRDYVEADFTRLDANALRARVRTEPSSGAVREIKGVTYHGLVVEETESGWRAQVIFDV